MSEPSLDRKIKGAHRTKKKQIINSKVESKVLDREISKIIDYSAQPITSQGFL